MTTATIKAGEDVKKGDLISVGNDGLGRFVIEPGQKGAPARPIGRSVNEVAINAVQENYFLGMATVDGSDRCTMAHVQLSNGDYAIGFVANGTVQVSTFAATGKLLNNQKFVVNDASTAAITMAVLPNDNFAVAFVGDVPAVMTVVVINNDGTLRDDMHTIPNASNVSSPSIAVLSDNTFVVGYAAGTDNHEVSMVHLDALGAIMAGPTIVQTFSTPVSNKQSVSVATLKDDKFAVVYSSTTDVSSKVNCMLFDHNSTQLSGTIKVGEDHSISPKGAFINTAALTGGGFAVSSYGGIGPGFQLSIYNDEGILQNGTIVLDSSDQQDFPNRMALAGLENGNVGVVWGGNYTFGAAYTAKAEVVFARANYGPSGGSVALAAIPGGAVIAFQSQAKGGTPALLNIAKTGLTMYGKSTETTVTPGVAYGAIVTGGLKNVLDHDAEMFFVGATSDVVQVAVLATYSLGAQSPIGVAEEDTVKGADLHITIGGIAKLRVPFVKPFVIDARGYPIPGQKLAVIGDTVILEGIQQ